MVPDPPSRLKRPGKKVENGMWEKEAEQRTRSESPIESAAATVGSSHEMLRKTKDMASSIPNMDAAVEEDHDHDYTVSGHQSRHFLNVHDYVGFLCCMFLH